MKDKREHQEVADSDKEDHRQGGECLMPNLPYADTCSQGYERKEIKQGAATKSNDAEDHRCQQLVALIRAEPEGLQQIEDQEYDEAIQPTILQPMLAVKEWISSVQ